MGWLSQLCGDAFAFGWAVLVHWGAYVIGGAPFIADEAVKRLSDRYREWSEKNRVLRRKFEIAAILGGLLFASFQAWQDEKIKFDTAETRRVSSQQWLGVWKTRADERWHAIHDKGGYLDQIAQSAPPKNDSKHGQAHPGPTRPPVQGAPPLQAEQHQAQSPPPAPITQTPANPPTNTPDYIAQRDYYQRARPEFAKLVGAYNKLCSDMVEFYRDTDLLPGSPPLSGTNRITGVKVSDTSRYSMLLQSRVSNEFIALQDALHKDFDKQIDFESFPYHADPFSPAPEEDKANSKFKARYRTTYYQCDRAKMALEKYLQEYDGAISRANEVIAARAHSK